MLKIPWRVRSTNEDMQNIIGCEQELFHEISHGNIEPWPYIENVYDVRGVNIILVAVFKEVEGTRINFRQVNCIVQD